MGLFKKPGENNDGRVVFGPHGNNIKEQDDRMFKREGVYRVSGEMIFGPNGNMARKSGNMIIQSKGGTQRTIIKSGYNRWHTDEGDYKLSGSTGTLYGPNGKVWHGVLDADQAERIIATDF